MLLVPVLSGWAEVGDKITFNKLVYTVTSEEDKTVELTGYSSSPRGEVVIPATVNEYTVTSIGTKAFRRCFNLKSVTIPDGVTSIGENAFNGCDALTKVNIPSGVTSIANGTFSGCDLRSVVLPENVTSIGDNAFYGCTSLKSIEMPDGLKNIGNSAFYSCTKLASVEIPASVTRIGDYAFASCNLLTTLDIPANETSIGANAFEGCKGLTEVNIYAGTLSSYGTEAFKNAAATLKINVFGDNVEAFQEGWKDYSEKFAAFPAEDLTVTGVTANQNPSETSEYWVTYYHPLANVKVNTTDVEIYIATLAEENDYVNLTQIEGNIIKAGQAVMLKAASADALAMELTPDAAKGNYSGNDLKGGSTVATDKVAYTLAAKNGRMGFYKFAGSALNPNKAHLELPSLAASVHEFIALDEEEATGVELVQEFKSLRVQDDAWYTLDGKKMVNGKWLNGKLPQGIYIHNGRKEAVR